jgi:hypothetical protein
MILQILKSKNSTIAPTYYMNFFMASVILWTKKLQRCIENEKVK